MTAQGPSSDHRKECVRHASLSRAKRAVDLAVAGLGLAIASPLCAFIAILIRLTSPGPVFYRRNVYGRGGRIFVMLKFRSMVENAHEILLMNPTLRQEYEKNLKIERDTRITPLGRFLRRSSLDELPQLLNILAGDMSLVGPRVLGDLELQRYGVMREKLLSVKPG